MNKLSLVEAFARKLGRSGFVVASRLPCTAGLQAASTIQFAAPYYPVAETAGSVTLTVLRAVLQTNDINTVVTVDYPSADGTATAGAENMAVSGTLTFAAGEATKAVAVPFPNPGEAVSRARFFGVVWGG